MKALLCGFALAASRAARTVHALPQLPLLLAVPGLVALVAEPALWLVRTWSDPSYQSDGGLVACAVVAIALRAWRSGPAQPEPAARGAAWRLLLAAAGLRLFGRLFAVHTIGALALVIDVAALARLLGLDRRPWAVHPAALAAFSTLALPVEHLLQRLLAHPLQLGAAVLAETLLSPFFTALERQGVLLIHPDVALAVDLPCSGARGLVLFGGFALALWCRRRAPPAVLLAAAAAVALGALFANALRIIGLFLGSAAQLPVVEEPWHSALGVASLALGCAPLCAVAARGSARVPRAGATRPARCSSPAPAARSTACAWALALGISVLGVGISSVPEGPVDVSGRELLAVLPVQLGALRGAQVALSEQERQYYARYGGRVDKQEYRDERGRVHTALLIRTTSPLRHMHGPDRCLLGAGHQVTRIGVRPVPLPSVIYRSVAPDGQVWRVEASFISDSGERASDVSEVVWRWLARPRVAWNLVERISAWPLCELDPPACTGFDAALFASLDLPFSPPNPDPVEETLR
jgi:exosortase/archaeosortase family protein